MEILTHCFAFVLDVFMFEVFVRFCAKMCRVVTDLKTFLLKNQKKRSVCVQHHPCCRFLRNVIMNLSCILPRRDRPNRRFVAGPRTSERRQVLISVVLFSLVTCYKRLSQHGMVNIFQVAFMATLSGQNYEENRHTRQINQHSMICGFLR